MSGVVRPYILVPVLSRVNPETPLPWEKEEKAMNDRYVLSDADWAELERSFTAHPALDGQAERYTAIRDRALDLAGFIAVQCPPSRERSLALTSLEQAVFWANAAIARHEGGAPDAD